MESAPVARTSTDPYHTIHVHLEEDAQDAVDRRRQLEDHILDTRKVTELAEREESVLAKQAAAMASLGHLNETRSATDPIA